MSRKAKNATLRFTFCVSQCLWYNRAMLARGDELCGQ